MDEAQLGTTKRVKKDKVKVTKFSISPIRAYASDDGSTFRMDFAWAKMKMSGLNVLTGYLGQVRRNCSLPMVSS